MGRFLVLLTAAITGFSIFFLFWASAANAEKLEYYLVDGVTYNQAVVKPDDFLGHTVGDQPIRHDRMVSYLESVARASNRMKVETIGYSHEGRPILFITVSSPENLARLDRIRQAHLAQIKGAPKDTSMPVITWINYGVHGAEASGMDAVVPTLYHLAAAEGGDIEATLDNSVILITAVFNPDGHARRASWVTSYGSKVVATDPAHDIHSTIWPGARTNHYWFDLNRQWLLQTQPESRAWLSQWHKWKPHVSADMHEMGADSTYYFHPGVPTRKYPLIPSEGRTLLEKISQYHTRYFDDEQKLYFAEEGFDNFYIGKGSTYPQVNGGLGILFEAGGQMGIAKDSNHGVKTYSNNIRNHMRTSLTTIEGAVALREDLADYQHRYFQSASELAANDPIKGYIFTAPEDPVRLYYFTDLLARHNVDFHTITDPTKINGKTYPVGSFYVSLNQRQYRMAKALFNRITEFPDKVFYDVSGWTLPLAYGLQYDGVSNRSIDQRLAKGQPAIPSLPSIIQPDRAPYAYVFSSSSYYAPRALNCILNAGLRARVLLEPVTVETTRGNVKLNRGAIVVPFERQTADVDAIHKIISTIAEKDRIAVHAVTSGRSLEPGRDLGARLTARDLFAPKPLMIVGQGVSSYDAGEVWHQLDLRMKIGLTITRKERLGAINWSEYTHLIIVGGEAPFTEAQTSSIRKWVNSGGVVVASRQGALWAAEKLLGYAKQTPPQPELERRSYAVKNQKDAEHIIGGAIFESDLDLAHPLAFGYVRKALASHRNTTIQLPLPKDPYAQVAVYSEKPLLSGYASPERQAQLANTPAIVAERMGRGSVVLFADNPNFRATFLGTEKLFLNALFFATAFDQARGEDEEDDEHTH